MTTSTKIAEVAFKLHEQERISRDELVWALEQLVNAAAIENGYADTHGLPFLENEDLRR